MAITSAGTVSLDMVLDSSAFEKKVRQVMNDATKTATKETKKIDSAFKTSMGNIGKYVVTAFSVAAVYNFTKSSVQYASEVQAAWSGLNSIVEGTGNSFAKAQKFLKEYTADGLVGISDATTAYKNLLARGYTTDQIEMTMERLKDAATFGRQASYSLSSAVVSATEGLKNENSVLVDNAGVTKNVAKMWDDYAASIGTTANNLTKQQKIQAEVLGIQEETKFQIGDSAAYLDTYAGKVAQLSSAFSDLKLAWGQVVTPIIELFIPAITSAIKVMTAFLNKIKQVLAVFGIEMKEYVTKDNPVASVGEQATSAAENIASTGDAAKKAAKKIKGAFNNVDEINVLKTKDDTAAGDTGTNDGTSGSNSPSVEAPVVTPTIDTTQAEKVNSILGKMFDFTNLINSFNRVKEAVQPVIDTISTGLKWAYDNVLVPFAKWTIEDALPAVLNVLAGVLDVLNPLLESLGRVLKPVWENILKPVLSWTGDAIVGILNGIADALSAIGKWMSEHSKTVDTIVSSLLIFFGLWEVTKLLAFIQMSGGLGAAFELMTSKIWGTVAAKIADKAETVILTAMYAKDFVVSLAASTAALVKNAAQWVVTTAAKVAATAATVAYNVAIGVATAATWLFNAAMAVLTSPITLVIAAIAALVAGIILLVKNWDKVKETASKVWDGIKAIWGKVASWFNTNVVQPIVKFFTNLWNKIKTTFSNVATWFKGIFAKAWTNIKSAWSSVGSWFGNVWTNIKSKFSNTATWFKDTFKKAYNGMKSAFSSVGSFFGGIWSTIKSKFVNIGQKIGDAVGGAFKSAINGLLKSAEKVLNAPIKAINTAIKVLNKVPGVNIGKLKEFSLPRLAEGGWFDANNPQLAIVGDNKREPEIVAPESKIEDAVVRGLARSGNNVANNKLELEILVKYEDGRRIIKKINDYQIQQGKVLLMT